MSPDAKERMSVYQEGQHSYRSGTPCPYSENNWRSKTWKKGWDAAREHYERRCAEDSAVSTPDETLAADNVRDAEIESLTAAHHAAVEMSNTMHGRWIAAEAERDALRKALMRVKTEAVSLADAQVIALEALKGDTP